MGSTSAALVVRSQAASRSACRNTQGPIMKISSDVPSLLNEDREVSRAACAGDSRLVRRGRPMGPLTKPEQKIQNKIDMLKRKWSQRLPGVEFLNYSEYRAWWQHHDWNTLLRFLHHFVERRRKLSERGDELLAWHIRYDATRVFNAIRREKSRRRQGHARAFARRRRA